jgi:hypothetical protein
VWCSVASAGRLSSHRQLLSAKSPSSTGCFGLGCAAVLLLVAVTGSLSQATGVGGPLAVNMLRAVPYLLQ